MRIINNGAFFAVIQKPQTILFLQHIFGIDPNTTHKIQPMKMRSFFLICTAMVTAFCHSAQAQVITTVAGRNGGGLPGDGIPATNATIGAPWGVTTNATGNFYVSDNSNHVIRKVNAAGIISTIAGTSGTAGSGGDGGAATAAELNYPRQIATDRSGNVYVADQNNNVIRKITAAGVVSTYAGSPTGDYGYADYADPSRALFKNPRSVAIDAAGNLYVADFGNNRIRKISTTGAVTTLAGDGNARYLNSSSEDNTASFNGPIAVAVDAVGNLYVADQRNYAIRKVNVSTGATSTVAGGLGYPDQIGSPVAITTDAQSNVYIADKGGRILELVVASRALYTLAGKLNTAGFINGAGADARFNAPSGVALDAAGNDYIADFNNNVIRKLAITVTP